jgi:hypothetical protein
MQTMSELKQEANKWWAVEMFTSVMQQLFFWAWIVVLLVVVTAPVWAWVVGIAYALGHTVHYISWLVANTALKNWKHATLDNAQTSPDGEDENSK